MIVRSLEVAKALHPSQIIMVVSPQLQNKLGDLIKEKIDYAIQSYPGGTADAAICAISKVRKDAGVVLILNGDDSAFFKPQTLKRVINNHIRTKSTLTLMTAKLPNPKGFGRIIRQNGRITDIIEEKDTASEQKKIKEVNVGIYAFDRQWADLNLPKISKSTVTGENYLTDSVKLASSQLKTISDYTLTNLNQWQSVNTQKDLEKVKLQFLKRIHIMGIAGAGASAVAGIASGYGYQVNGCDLIPKSSYTASLKIKVLKGHNPKHIKNISTLVVSPAILKYDPQNIEVSKAKKQKIPVISWQQFQGKFLQKNKFVIAVAGAYGKSTTTALLSQILIDAGLDPTCEIGATVLSWGTNFRVGDSKYYVCEADEYNDNFLNYNPDIAVVLNMSWDHPDYFKTKERVFDSYEQFINKIKNNGVLVIAQDPSLEKLAKLARSDIKIAVIGNYDNYKLSIIGDFRRENAHAALTVAKILEINSLLATQSIQNFSGVARRLEFRGKIDNVRVYDDYAVQPYTVLTTANALKEKFKNSKVVLVLEPHTFSRINIFFDDFVKNLKKCRIDKILITEVYPAREKGNKKEIAAKLAKAIGHKATFTGSITDTANYLEKSLKGYDVICSMGAGNVHKLYDTLISLL